MNGDDLDLVAWAHQAEAAASIARQLAATSFIPDQIKVWEHPEQARYPDKRGHLELEATVAQVTAVFLAGQELGFKPMASLRAFTVIRGQVAMYALAARALLLKHGHEIVIRPESNSERAIVDGRRAGAEQWQRSTWDIARARLAKLYPGPDNGNWVRQPKAMLIARATAEVSRWVAADALLGLPVMVEELEGEQGADGQGAIAAIEPGTLPDGAAPAPKRAKRKPPSTARAALPSGPPAAEIPPEPVPPQRTLKENTKKRTAMFAALTAIGVTDREEARGMIAAWLGHPVASSNDLTEADANVVIERAEAIKSIAATDQGEPAGEGGGDAEPDQG
jgi:hypothetical protein